jgi:two-component system NtrC family sensor kinase
MTGDQNQIQQVLVNIILNAVQASDAGGSIHLKSYKEIDYIAVEIIDTGIGIKNEQVSKVFDPFFTTKSEGEGTGLGLSVSYGIVKHHGGTIHVENNPDQGLRVVILLPFQAQIEQESDESLLEAKHVV